MENATKRAPTIEGERKERTVTIRIVKAPGLYESALADERWSRVLKKYHEWQENGEES